MPSLIKFSAPQVNETVEFCHPNIWDRTDYTGWSRLCIGAERGEASLILDLCRTLQGPFGILYVLLTSRLGREPGRYQSDPTVNYSGLQRFFSTFGDFIEQDGRHHLWVSSIARDGQIIFDQHNHIYAYGDLSRYEAVLTARGFKRGPIATPVPHAHHFHPEFDAMEDNIFSYWEWRHFPLAEGDDD